MLSKKSIFIWIIALSTCLNVYGQSQDVTFRYIPGEEQTVFRAFLPGEFNNWGPNNNGVIEASAPSLMTFVDTLGQWVYTIPLDIGTTYEYKVHVHLNEAGTDWNWITDPLNPRVNTADNNNSIVTVTDPMVFLPARESENDGLINAVSASLFGTSELTDLRFWINGVERDGLPFYNSELGVFRFELENPVREGSQFKIRIMDSMGGVDSVQVGDILLPLSWAYPDFKTVREYFQLKGNVTRQDGTVDSSLTTAEIGNLEGAFEDVDVDNGSIETTVQLEEGANAYVLRAEIDGVMFESDTLRIERIQHPLDAFLLDPSAGGSGFSFTLSANPVEGAPSDMTVRWVVDEMNSTTTLSSSVQQDMNFSGTAEGPGELYIDVVAESTDGQMDRQRVGLVVEDGGTVRQMRYEETPEWVNQAVVYEIFPLSFGPAANGSESNPGDKFNEITENLDYIAEMGFNTIWFMPVMKNQIMDQVSGGYNIVDFYNVDPTLGTNDDFKALVARAHELGIKIIMDITPNHASPIHPWVNALRESGNEVPPGSFVQTEPSSHNRGLDNRGPNLEEVWQQGENGNLYRKYNGFGDLANLDWDNDDLQAEFLNIIAHWIQEFDIDGWRFDVYWGPWRRYGPERFGQPIRELMKRIKPDSWLLGEIAGTGFSTEVYYSDDDNGTPVIGGIDAGYDWIFFFDAVRGTYGNISNYDSKALNGNFWPGPHARYFRFLENHDEERIAKLLRSNTDGILPLTGLILTTTGVPMIYQGQEVNFGDVSGDERRVSVDWNTERNGEFARYHQELAHARSTFSAFGTQDQVTLNTSNNVYAFVRPYLDENAVVLINFSGSEQTITIDPTDHIVTTADGPIVYTDILADSAFVDQGLDGFSVDVPPYQTVIYIANNGEEVDFQLPALPQLPFSAVYTSNEGEEGAHTYQVELGQNYPNPFTGETTITYSTAKEGTVRLMVYDVLGRVVQQVVNEYQTAGPKEVQLDLKRLPSGVYFYRLETGDQVLVKQLTKLK